MSAFFCWIGASSWHSVFSALRRTSLLNSSKASASVVAAASSVDAASASVAAVAIASGLTSVPSLYASACSATSASSLLDVKSVSTFSLEPMVMIATRSAAVILSATHSRASSTARWTSSGCIELTSNTMVSIRRFKRLAASAAEAGVAVSAGVALTARAASARTLSSSPSSSWRSGVPAGAAEISWKENVEIVCGLPSSETTKSFAVSPRTTFPDESRTTTSTDTMVTLAELSNRGASGGCGGCCLCSCCCAVGRPVPTASTMTSAIAVNRRPFRPAPPASPALPACSIMLEPEPQIQRGAALTADASDLPECGRVHVGVHTRVVRQVQQVVDVHLDLKISVPTQLDLTIEVHVQVLRAGTDDDVARRRAEVAGLGYREGGGVEPLIDRRIRDRQSFTVVVGAQRPVDAAGDVAPRAAHRNGLRPSRVGAEIRADPPATGDPGPQASVTEPALVRPEWEAIVPAQGDAVALLEAGP